MNYLKLFESFFEELLGTTKSEKLLKKIGNTLSGHVSLEARLFFEEKSREFYFLRDFNGLNIDQKLSFFREFERTMDFIVVRGYIYAVVDESKLEESLDSLVYKMETIKSS